jgi:hypothetical protein
VDFAEGNDNSSGVLKEQAYQHCPGDNNAQAKASATKLQPGDRVVFKGGVVYTGTIRLLWSGASDEERIVYDGNSAGDWGKGKAVFSSLQGEESSSAFIGGPSPCFITIQSMEFARVGGFREVPSPNSCKDPVRRAPKGTGIDLSKGGEDIVIRDCYFHEIGEWRNQDPLSARAIDGRGIALQNTTRVLIDRCEFTRMHTGISIKSYKGGKTSQVEVSNCDFHNYLVWCIDIAPRSRDGNFFIDISIHDSRFHDYAEYDSKNWKGCGEKPHTDGIFLRTSGMENSTWENVRIYNNDFYNDSTKGGGTACVYLSQGPSAMIYNNVFTNTFHGRTILVGAATPDGTSEQVVRIYNNTFYNDHTAIGMTKGDRRKVYIVNNIFYDPRSARTNVAVNNEDGVSLPIEMDYNHYFTYNLKQVVYAGKGHGWLSLGAIRSRFGWEIHNSGGISDPKFMDISRRLGEKSSSNNLRLSKKSPCRKNAKDLSEFFQHDKDGNPRPNGKWDVGAYQTH